jgi:hypothetical protein
MAKVLTDQELIDLFERTKGEPLPGDTPDISDSQAIRVIHYFQRERDKAALRLSDALKDARDLRVLAKGYEAFRRTLWAYLGGDKV